MNDRFEANFTLCSNKDFLRMENLIRGYHYDKSAPALDQAFADGVPRNGYIRDANNRIRTYLDSALLLGNGAAMGHLIRVNYEAFQNSAWDFSSCMRYPAALQALADCGHSFAGVLEQHTAYFWMGARSLGPEFFLAIAKLGANFDGLVKHEQWLVPAIARYAMFPEAEDLVGSLLAAGADPNTRGMGGMSVLHGGVTEGRTRAKQKLDAGSHFEEFEALVEKVVAAGGDVDMVDDLGRSALHEACSLGYFNKARLLVEAGADPQLKDKKGISPEDLVRTAGRTDVLQLFASIRAKRAILSTVSAALGRSAGGSPSKD